MSPLISLDAYDRSTGLYFNFITHKTEGKGFISAISSTENYDIFIYNTNI